MTTMKRLDKTQRELVMGDIMDQLGHDLRITVEWYGDDGLEATFLEGTVFAEDKAFWERPVEEEGN